ncbi:hypothetical protein [Okeania sp. KiyG1]|nr:hypothetical protein [Okeania sp. KiyG1]
MIRDRKGEISLARREGIEIGREEGIGILIKRQIRRKFGEIA